MIRPEAVPLIVASAVTIVAATTDLWKFKVYNALTLPALAGGVVVSACLGGASGLGSSLLGASAGFFVLAAFFALGGVGAGDVKLFAALGAWLGPWPTMQVFAASALMAGLYAVVLSVLNRRRRRGRDPGRRARAPDGLARPLVEAVDAHRRRGPPRRPPPPPRAVRRDDLPRLLRHAGPLACQSGSPPMSARTILVVVPGPRVRPPGVPRRRDDEQGRAGGGGRHAPRRLRRGRHPPGGADQEGDARRAPGPQGGCPGRGPGVARPGRRAAREDPDAQGRRRHRGQARAQGGPVADRALGQEGVHDQQGGDPAARRGRSRRHPLHPARRRHADGPEQRGRGRARLGRPGPSGERDRPERGPGRDGPGRPRTRQPPEPGPELLDPAPRPQESGRAGPAAGRREADGHARGRRARRPDRAGDEGVHHPHPAPAAVRSPSTSTRATGSTSTSRGSSGRSPTRGPGPASRTGPRSRRRSC